MNRRRIEEMLEHIDMSKLKGLRNLDADDVLDLVGLQRKGTDWGTAITALGVGILVGAGLGLMLAPKSGADLRDDLRERLGGEDSDPHSHSMSHKREPAVRGA